MVKRWLCHAGFTVSLALAVCAVHSAALPIAIAQPAAAETLFDEARDAMKEERWEEAAAKLSQSDELDPQPGTKFNWAFCEEKLGRIASAWELYRAAIKTLPPEDDRVPFAEERVAALEPRLPRLSMRLSDPAPEGLTVELRHATLDKAAMNTPLPLDPGEQRLVVQAPGHEPRELVVVMVEGELTEVAIEPGPRAEQAQPPPPVVPGPAAADPGPPWATIGWIVGSVGAAGLVVGSVTGVLALGEQGTAFDHCNDASQTCDAEGVEAADAGRTLGTVTTIGWIAGASLVTAGVVMIVVGNDEGTAAATLSVHPSPTGGAFVGRVAW